MSASQAPNEFQLHDAGNFGDSNTQTATITSVQAQPLDIDAFIMEQNQHSQIEHLGHDNSGGLSMPSAQFVDFSYPFQDLSHGQDGGNNIEQQHDPYANMSARGSVSEHRASVTSMAAARASFSSNAPLMVMRNGSVEDSDDASPQSARARGNSLVEDYGDEFALNGSGVGDGSDLGTKNKDDKNDLQPAWTELKTKAGKERKRLPLACIACRRKKIRCSGEKPACKHCVRSRIPCVYKVTARKAAPRTDYMAMLDKRLKRMEERIIKIVPKEEQEAIGPTRAQVKPAIPGTVPARATNGKKRAADEAFSSDLETWAKVPTKVKIDGGVATSLLVQEAEETKLLTEGADALPSQELQEHLAEVFFDNLYGQAYHLLHKPSFMRKLKAGTVPPVLTLAVCAVSARFSTHPKLNTSGPAFLRGEAWASEARDIVLRRYEWPNITILTCLLLLGLHEFGTCYGGRSWAFAGMAIRMAYALQLHRDLDHDPCKRNDKTPLSFIDREIRRRTMWACFLMDRFNSSGTDRPMFMKEDSIKVQLPIQEKYFQMDMAGPTEDLHGFVPAPLNSGEGKLADPTENMGVAAHMIRSVALWGRIIVYLFQGGKEIDGRPTWHPEAPFASLSHQADSFPKKLNESLKYTKTNLNRHETENLANQFLFLHLSAQCNIAFLNHIAVREHLGGRPPKDISRDFVTTTAGKAMEAAKKISEILRASESYSVTAPFAGYCAFLSSTVQMPAVFSSSSETATDAKRNLATNVRYLAKMKKYWGAFHWTSENLKELYKNCADAAHQGPNGGGTNKPIFQYGDWFDRYPHGVSQSDFEDPATAVKKEKGDDAVLEQKSGYQTVEEFFHSMSTHTPADRDSKPNKRRGSKKVPQPLQSQTSSDIQGPNSATNIAPQLQMHTPSLQQLQMAQQQFPQMSPTHAPNMYQQMPAFYNNDLLFAAPQQGMLPQLDRQLVFGAYAGMDPSHINPIASPWDMAAAGGGMDMTDFSTEPTSAWFMPFNMEPPEILPDDPFMVGNAIGYSMGGMVGNQPNGGMGGRGGGGGGVGN